MVLPQVEIVLHINETKWSISDPDNILSYKPEEDSDSTLRMGIHPREDMLQLTHKESNCIIDFGYYDCETKLNGLYAVYVLDGNLVEAWDKPMELHESGDFMEGITHVQSMLDKYT